jgi:hypothetical protein
VIQLPYVRNNKVTLVDIVFADEALPNVVLRINDPEPGCLKGNISVSVVATLVRSAP